MSNDVDPQLHILNVRIHGALWNLMKTYSRRQFISIGKKYSMSSLVVEAVIEKLKREGFVPENTSSGSDEGQ